MDPKETTEAETQAVEKTAGELDLRTILLRNVPKEPEPESSPEQPEPEEQPAGEEEAGGNVSNDAPPWVSKRIDKLTRKRKEAEEALQEEREKLEQLRSEFEEFKTRKPRTEVDKNLSPLEQAETPAELDALEAQSKDFQRWARRALTRYKRDPEGVETEIAQELGGKTPDDVESFLEEALFNAIDTVEDGIPKRRLALQERSKYLDLASKQLPWMADPYSQQRKWVDNQMLTYPQLRDIPEAPLILGHALVGMAVMQGKGKAQEESPEPTAQPTAPAAAPQQLAAIDAELADAKERFKKTGSADDRRALIKAKLNKQFKK